MAKTLIEITDNKYSITFEGVSQEKQKVILETINKLINGILKITPEEEYGVCKNC